MARKRPAPPASPAPSERGSPAEPPPDRETCGPVAITRHVKDDGRGLILYTHVERDPR